MTKSSLLLMSSLCVLPAACGGDDGTLVVTIYGEEFVEEGISADEMDDGWAVSFDSFVVTVDRVEIAGMTISGVDPVDISTPTNGSGQQLSQQDVAAGEYTDTSYTISRVEVAGKATKDGVEKTFAWDLAAPTRYLNCETTTVVEASAPGTFQITVHADHLFYDSIVAEEPQLFFQAFADADSDADGSITWEELSAQGIGAYDPGNADIDNLADWVIALSQTLGHVDGEGHCDVEGQV